GDGLAARRGAAAHQREADGPAGPPRLPSISAGGQPGPREDRERGRGLVRAGRPGARFARQPLRGTGPEVAGGRAGLAPGLAALALRSGAVTPISSPRPSRREASIPTTYRSAASSTLPRGTSRSPRRPGPDREEARYSPPCPAPRSWR